VELDQLMKNSLSMVSRTEEKQQQQQKQQRLVVSLTPEYRYIWMTGFVPREEEHAASWVNSLPNFACKRYPKAKVFVIKQDRTAVSVRNVGKAPLRIERFSSTLSSPS